MFHVETLQEALDDYGGHLTVVVELPSGYCREIESVITENTPDGPRVTLTLGEPVTQH